MAISKNDGIESPMQLDSNNNRRSPTVILSVNRSQKKSEELKQIAS